MLAIVDSVWQYLYTFWPVWPTISLSFILLWSVVTLLYTPLHSLCLTFHACNFKLASSFSLPLAYQLSPWLHAFVHCLDKDRSYLVEILAQPFPCFITVPLSHTVCWDISFAIFIHPLFLCLPCIIYLIHTVCPTGQLVLAPFCFYYIMIELKKNMRFNSVMK